MKKLILIILTILSIMPISWAETEDNFIHDDKPKLIDVDETTKYNRAIMYLKNNEIVQGYKENNGTYTFKPEQTINRAELLKILLEGTKTFSIVEETPVKPERQEECFTDVKDEWFAPYVCYAKDKGIIKGYADGSFKPAQEVKFVEAMKMLLGVLGIPQAEGDIWYENIIKEASKKRFIPFDITSFDQNLSRGQMAEMMTRAIKDKNGNGELDWHLQNTGDCQITYEDIAKNTNIEETCFTTITLNGLYNKKWTELVGKNTSQVNLSYRSLEKVTGLEKLPNLTKLDLGANELQDITFLEKLTKLQELDLRDNWLWGVGPLARLKNLEKLNLNLNIMGDPAPLGKLTKLKWLGLYKNQYLYDISALDSLTELEYIDLGLATLNEGELERFTEKHPETEIENELKPWVGKKTFDLKEGEFIMGIDLTEMFYTKDVFAFLSSESAKILKNINTLNYSYDDIEQIKYHDLFKIKGYTVNSSEEYLWDSHIHPQYLAEVLKGQERVKNTSFSSRFWGKKSDRFDYFISSLSINFNFDISFKRVSQEIVKDRQRKGEQITGNQLLDNFNAFKTFTYEKHKYYSSYWKDLDTIKYLLRYPEIKSIDFDLDIIFKDSKQCDENVLPIMGENKSFKNTNIITDDLWLSCRMLEFNFNNRTAYIVGIEYGEGQDCQSGCIYDGYCSIIEGDNEYFSDEHHDLLDTEEFKEFLKIKNDTEFRGCSW